MNATLLLAIATLALAVGPLLERIGRRWPLSSAVIDGATVGAIVAVSCLHLMPEAGAHLSWWSAVLFLLGLALPQFTERIAAQSWRGWRVLLGLVVAVLFAVHLLAEGAALASSAANERVALATLFAVASHNLPVGAVLWGQTRRRFGAGWSVAVLVIVGALTWFGPWMIPIEESTVSAACSALLAGGLLHLVVQHGEPVATTLTPRVRHWGSGLGALAAFTLLAWHLQGQESGVEHAHAEIGLVTGFIELFLETAPALFFGLLGAGLVEAFLPDHAARFLARGSRLRQALAGVAVGAPLPVCSCGVLPIYRSLIHKGVPASAALALLVAAPEIGVDSFLLSWQLLGPTATWVRVGSALFLALAIGWVLGRSAERDPLLERPHEHVVSQPASPWRRVGRGVFEAWEHLSPWILVGLFATVLVEPWISAEWARELPDSLEILALTLIGLPTYICAAAATPFAALLLLKGFSLGAVIAFLLVGPASNLTTFGALRRLHSARLAWAFVALAIVVTLALGLLINATVTLDVLPSVAGGGEHAHGWFSLTCAAALIVLTVAVVLTSGPRGYLAQLGSATGREEHAHQQTTASAP